MKTASNRAPHWSCHRALALVFLLLFSIQWVCVSAHFVANLSVVGFDNPSNTNATGACCSGTQTAGACSTPCTISKYHICIRSSSSNLPATNECPTLEIESNSGGIFHSSEPWPGRAQILITPLGGDGNPVEVFIIDYNAEAAQSEDRVTADILSVTGRKNNTVLNLTLSVQCQSEFHGPMCDCQDRNDSSGHFTCIRNGDIECLEGYQNPSTSCTECSGCLSTGVMASSAVLMTQSPSVQTVLLSTVTSSSAIMMMSSSIQLSGMMSSTELPMEPSVTVDSSSIQFSPSADLFPVSPTMTSLLSTPPFISTSFSTMVRIPSISLVQSTQGPPPSTPALIAESTIILSSSLRGLSSLPSSSLSLTPLPTVFTTTAIQQLSSSPLVTSTITRDPETTVIRPTTSLTQEPQSTTIQQPPTTTVQESQTSPSSTPEQSTVSETLTSSNTNAQLSITPVIITPTSSTSPPLPPAPPAPGQGNQAVIAGAVGVIAAVVILIILAIPCVYLIMRRKRRNENKRAAVFLDNVYNTPVTFVNAGHEAISPRSPELYVSGVNERENRGTHLDVSHRPTFPGVSYREHVPYAATGPSSDHAESPEEPSLQQVEDGEVTIIINPHSFSSHSSQSPLPSTPAAGSTTPPITASSSPNRRSGLGFEYKDDPVGDRAYLDTQYSTEEPFGSSPQSSSVTTGGGGSEAAPSLPSVPPPLPPRVLLTPSDVHNNNRGSGREQKSRGKGDGAGKQTSGSGKQTSGSGKQMSESGKQTSGSGKPGKGRRRERRESEDDEEEEGMKRRVSEYLQAAQEEGEKRQSFLKDINFFTDINLDMTTQTEL